MSEIAKMFASVGFRVDDSSLQRFEARLAGTQTKIATFAHSIDDIGKSANRSLAPLNNLIRSLDFKGKATGLAPIISSLNKLATALNNLNNTNLHTKVDSIIASMNNLRPTLHRTSNAWDRYAEAVSKAKAAMGGGWGGGRPPAPPSGGTGAGGRGFGGGGGMGGGYSSSPHYTPQSRLLAPMVGSHLAYLASGGVMAGVGAIYAAKATLDRAQENVTAENFVKMASANDKEFEQNKKWLWDKSMYYGTDINANMEGFGKIYMNTSDSLGRDKSLTVIEDIMKYNTAMHTSREAQKFINKSLYQMAGTAQVNAQDYNQWEEHVAGGQKVAGRALDILAEEKGGKYVGWREFGTAKKAISEIKIEGKDLVPALTKAMAEASSKGLETGRTGYQAEGTRFQNRVTGFARELADGGLFDAGKGFFKLLNSIMEVLQAMMPVWNVLSQTIGFFFTTISDGLEFLKRMGTELLNFTSFTDSATKGTLGLQMVMWALVASVLPALLAGLRSFMMAVKVLMMSNPITAGLIIILTLLGFLYGQWKRQQEGLSNWFDLASAVFYLVKESFGLAIDYMRLKFWEFIVALQEGFGKIPDLITKVFDRIRDESPFLRNMIEMLERVGMLEQSNYDQRRRQREADEIAVGREQAAQRPSYIPSDIPVANIPKAGVGIPTSSWKVAPITLDFKSRDGKPLGKTTANVVNAVN